jgi:hypothetical protein
MMRLEREQPTEFFSYKVQETLANCDSKQCLQVGTSAYTVSSQCRDKIFYRRFFHQVKSLILQPQE